MNPVSKYVVEFIGTFFLVLTIGCVVIGGGANISPVMIDGVAVGGGGSLAPLAIGSALMVMIFSGGHISGGHFNPAVTLGVTLRGKCSPADVVPYMVCQVLGAAVAAFAVTYLYGPATGEPLSLTGDLVGKALLAEFLFTFALVWVVLNSATANGTSGNSFYGLAIGFTVLTGAFAVGGISGGAFNPAVAIGITMMKLTMSQNIWIYMVANFLAAVAAAGAFKFCNGPDPTDS